MKKTIIETGKYGITRTQMLKAMNNAFNEDNTLEILTDLYNNYKDIFIPTVRYLKKKNRNFVIDNFDLSISTNISSKYGTTKTQVLNAIRDNISNKDYIVNLFNNFPTLANATLRYLKKNEKNLVLSYLNPVYFKDNYKYTNNAKLANLIKSNINKLNSFSDFEKNLINAALNDDSISNIATKFNLSKDKVYNILFRNNGRSIICKLS